MLEAASFDLFSSPDRARTIQIESPESMNLVVAPSVDVALGKLAEIRESELTSGTIVDPIHFLVPDLTLGGNLSECADSTGVVSYYPWGTKMLDNMRSVLKYEIDSGVPFASVTELSENIPFGHLIQFGNVANNMRHIKSPYEAVLIVNRKEQGSALATSVTEGLFKTVASGIRAVPTNVNFVFQPDMDRAIAHITGQLGAVAATS